MDNTQAAAPTPEEIEAKKKAEAEAKKAEKAALKKAEADAKKAEKDRIAAEKAAQKDLDKAAKEADKVAKAAEKLAKAEAAKAAKEANRMPEQNGVRRPKPDTLCGKAWALADKLSAELGQPTPIANLLEAARAEGLNEGNVKAEYARWRKFLGVSGRVSLPKPEAEAPANTEGNAEGGEAGEADAA